MTYDTWKCSGADYAGDERDDRDESAVRCARCSSQGMRVCWCPDEFDAAESGEGDDMENDNGSAALVAVKDMTEVQLVALRNAIDIELRTRVELHERLAKAARQALSGTKPRATRKDAGTKRGPKAVVAA